MQSKPQKVVETFCYRSFYHARPKQESDIDIWLLDR